MLLFPVLKASLAPVLYSPLGARLAGVLFASLWQGSLLISFLALALRCLPKFTAAARAGVWAIALVAVALHPALMFFGRPGPAASAGLVHAQADFGAALVGTWALASLFRLFQLGIGGLELWRILRSAQPLAAPPAVAALLRGAPRQPELCSSASVNRPCIAGFWRPRLLLPADLLPALNEAELTQIVLHELEHLRRGDDWVNLLQGIAPVLLPLHPALPWLNRRLALERELACDDAVLRTTRAHRAYAACLAHVAEQSLVRRGLSLAVGALGSWHRRSELTARIERILGRPEGMLTGLPSRFATGLVLAGTLAAGGVLAGSPALVSFGPMPAVAAVAVAAEFPVGARLLPAASRVPNAHETDKPHAVLMEAVMPVGSPPATSARTAHRAHAAVFRRAHQTGTLKIGLVGGLVQGRERGTAAPWMVFTNWYGDLPSRRQSAREMELRVRALPVVYAARLVPATVETQPVWYTAVRFADGWLVVQL